MRVGLADSGTKVSLPLSIKKRKKSRLLYEPLRYLFHFVFQYFVVMAATEILRIFCENYNCLIITVRDTKPGEKQTNCRVLVIG